MKQALVILYDINAKSYFGIYPLPIHSTVTLDSPTTFTANITNPITETTSEEDSKSTAATRDETSSGNFV